MVFPFSRMPVAPISKSRLLNGSMVFSLQPMDRPIQGLFFSINRLMSLFSRHYGKLAVLDHRNSNYSTELFMSIPYGMTFGLSNASCVRLNTIYRVRNSA